MAFDDRVRCTTCNKLSYKQQWRKQGKMVIGALNATVSCPHCGGKQYEEVNSMQNVMEQVNENISKLTDEEQFLIATCVENILNGSHWGVMNKMQLNAYENPLKYNNSLTSVFEVGGKDKTYLVQANDVRVALKLLQRVAPTLIDADFVNRYISKTKEAHETFNKFLEKTVKGKGFKGYVGVNSINSTPTMTYNKDRHKAFQLPITTVVTSIANGVGWGAIAFVNGKSYPFADLTDETYLKHVIANLVPSEGGTSLVLPLAIKGSK